MTHHPSIARRAHHVTHSTDRATDHEPAAPSPQPPARRTWQDVAGPTSKTRPGPREASSRNQLYSSRTFWTILRAMSFGPTSDFFSISRSKISSTTGMPAGALPRALAVASVFPHSCPASLSRSAVWPALAAFAYAHGCRAESSSAWQAASSLIGASTHPHRVRSPHLILSRPSRCREERALCTTGAPSSRPNLTYGRGLCKITSAIRVRVSGTSHSVAPMSPLAADTKATSTRGRPSSAPAAAVSRHEQPEQIRNSS